MRTDSIKRQENYKKYLAKENAPKAHSSGVVKPESKSKLDKFQEKASEKIKAVSEKLKEAGGKFIDKKSSTLINALGLSKDIASSMSSSLGGITSPESEVPATANENKENKQAQKQVDQKKLEEAKAKKTSNVKKFTNKSGPKPIEKPALFFIKGFDLFSWGRDGLEQLSKAYEGSEIYEWDQTDEMIFEIKRRPSNQPIILVGHSLGSDTAIEIANELNTIENKFKKIDLIISMDSVGFNNDIIPANVKRNLNFISDGFTFLSDHPNIARDFNSTKVENILSEKSHTQIDNTTEVQSKIIETIDKTLDA